MLHEVNRSSVIITPTQDFLVNRVHYENNSIWINNSTCFTNIPENVWNYYIGGYQVLEKWLDYRKKSNYTLDLSDITHFMNVCKVINKTIDIEENIDDLTRDWI